MKVLIGMLIGLLGSAVVIFFDVKLVMYLCSIVPNGDYSGLIKAAIIFFDIWLTLGFCFIPFAIGTAIGGIMEATR